MKTGIFVFLFIGLNLTIVSSYCQKPSRGKDKTILSGTVYESNNKPVEKAYIFIDNTGTGVTTDADGKFKVKTSSGARILLAVSPDKGSAAKAIEGSQSDIDLVLNGKISDLPLFASQYILESKSSGKRGSKRDNTYYRDIYELIRARLPGVLVSGRSVVIQQPNSFFGSSTPLFIVNGARVSSVDYINPAEVKSIELLTGSQATMYGVEGANGVISITLVNGADK
jgi:TonB-dependent starch-binding outer membrane protein SusC